MKVICLNGAPRSGKDTVGMLLQSMSSDVLIMKFAEHLDNIAQTVLGVDDNYYQILREDKKDQPLKSTSSTMRDLLIGISEDLMKPIFGKTYFAEAAASKIQGYADGDDPFITDDEVFVITDCGFQYEYDHFKSRMKELNIPVKLVQIQRDGTNFDNDSREFVVDKEHFTLLNNGSLDNLEEKVAWLLSDSCCGYCHEHPNKKCPTPL